MKIWMINHYATNQFFDKTGRHHALSKYLLNKNHDVKIFCANTIHNSDDFIDLKGDLFIEKTGADDTSYIFVKAKIYKGNGLSRIMNILSFYKNIIKTGCFFLKNREKPDVILASSVHPLTLVAGLKLAKRSNVPCICEIRDLWPETFLDFGFTKKNLIIKALYAMEKWIYKKADALIFTMEGGKDYIKEKHWEDSVDLSKVFYINNGVDLDVYYKNIRDNTYIDKDLENNETFKVIYTGSIRPANGVENIIKCARHIKQNEIEFLIFGDGSDKKRLEEYCFKNDISNVKFKGKVDKKFVPYILSKGDLSLLNYKQCKIDRFGTSQNKLFEYLASGRPVIANVHMGYDIIEKYQCGIAQEFNTDKEYADAILSIKKLPTDSYQRLCNNARQAAEDFDYKEWADRLEKIICQLG